MIPIKRQHVHLSGIILAILVALIFILLFIVELLLPRFINIPALKEKIEASILQSTGIRAQVQTLAIRPTILNGFEVDFKNNILTDPTDVRVVQAGHIKVNVRYLPLLAKKTSISRIAFDDVSIYIGASSFLFHLKKPKTDTQTVFLNNAEIVFNRYHIVVDKYFDSQNEYFFRGPYLALRHYKSDYPLELLCRGSAYFGHNNHGSKIGDYDSYVKTSQALATRPHFDWHDIEKMQLRLNDIHLFTATDIFHTYHIPAVLHGRLDQLTFDISGRKAPKQFVFYGFTQRITRIHIDRYAFVFEPGNVIFKTLVNLNPRQQVASLDKILLDLQSKTVHVRADGRILLKKPVAQSRFDMRLNTDRLPVHSLQLFLANISVPQRQLLEHMTGLIQTHLHVAGTLKAPQVGGSITLHHVGVSDTRQAGTWLAHDMDAVLNIKDALHYKLSRVSGQLAGSPMVGWLNVDLQQHRLHGQLNTNDTHLSQLMRLIREAAPLIKTGSPLLPVGRSDIAINAEGPIHNPRFNGTVRLKQAGLGNPVGHVALLQNINGTVKLNGSTLQTTGIKGQLGASQFNLKGGLDTEQRLLNIALKSSAIDLTALRQLVVAIAQATNRPLPWLSSAQIQGAMPLDLTASGSWANPALLGHLMVKNARIQNHRYNLAMNQINANVFLTEQGLSIAPLTGSILNNPLRIQGTVSDKFQRFNNLSIKAPNLVLETLMPTLSRWIPKLSNLVTVHGPASLNLVLNGPVHHPIIAGTVQLKGIQTRYRPKNLHVDNLLGTLAFASNQVYFRQVRGRFEFVPFKLDGQIGIPAKNYQLHLVAQRIGLPMLTHLLTIAAPKSQSIIRQIRPVSGQANVNLIADSRLPAPHLGGTITLHHVVARPVALGQAGPVSISQLSYNVRSGRIQSAPSAIRIAGIAMDLSGTVTRSTQQLMLKSHIIPVSSLRDILAALQPVSSVPLPVIYNTAGKVQFTAQLMAHQPKITFNFYHASASFKQLPYPVSNMNGQLILGLGKAFSAYTDQLSLYYANSPITLTCDIHTLKDIYLEASGTIAPLVLNDLLIGHNFTTIMYAAVPFQVTLSGRLGQLGGSGAGNNLNGFVNFNVASLFAAPGLAQPQTGMEKPTLGQATLSSVLHLNRNTLTLEQTRLKVDDENSLLLQGQVRELFRPAKRVAEVSLDTEPSLDLTALARQLDHDLVQGLGGSIVTHLKLLLAQEQIGAQGTLEVNHLKSEPLTVNDLTGKVSVENQKAQITVNHFAAPGMDLGFTADIPALAQYPVVVQNFNVTGKEFVVTEYIDFVNSIVLGKIRHGFWEKFFPPTGRISNLPFDIQSGHLVLDEGVLNNIIVNHYQSHIRVYPNSAFQLENVEADAAGGHATGHFAMNTRNNNEMAVHLDISKAKANAVTRILLNVSNQLFGDLSGVVDYTTQGVTQAEQLANTNGSADLKVENGRLPSLAKIQNLLIAANTVSGGLANLNLNSILHLADPFRTDYFATLSGSFQMVQGVVNTNDMKSVGKDLSLNFKGKVHMVDSVADMDVHGETSREIGGVLGPLGDISVGKFLGILPPLQTILAHIPGLGFVPGFGGPRGDKGVAFDVKIEGPLLDPSSVKDFHWSKNQAPTTKKK